MTNTDTTRKPRRGGRRTPAGGRPRAYKGAARHVHFWLSEKEIAFLDSQAAAAGITRTDYLRRLIAHAQAPWQPIESGPCDGTLVLLWAAETGFAFGYRDGPERHWRASRDMGTGPTHWLPLPEPTETP